MSERLVRSSPFAAYWLAGIALLLWSGGQPNLYRVHVMKVPLPHPYPWEGVLTFMAIASVEVLFVLFVIRPWSYRRSWPRALFAFVVSLVFVVLFAPIMHMPPFIGWHWLWLVVGSFALFVLFCSSLRRRSPGNKLVDPLGRMS